MSSGIARFARKKAPSSQGQVAGDADNSNTGADKQNDAPTNDGFGGFGPGDDFVGGGDFGGGDGDFGGWGGFGQVDDNICNSQFDSFCDDIGEAGNFNFAESSQGIDSNGDPREESKMVSIIKSRSR